MNESDIMRLAIAQARKAMGKTHPNPAVGAIIVHECEIVAEGFTQPAGFDHAEVVALKKFRESGVQPNGTTQLYVTMEPCSTHGKTPPCTEAIIESGIKSVYVGATDPNPAHAGAGLRILEEAGLSVAAGLLATECDDLNLVFNWVMKNSSPMLAGKIATTIDGRIATRGGLSKWITGIAARQDVHFWRRYFPAIAVGAGTVIADDPSLTARIEGEDEWCPIRFVFDRNLITFREDSRKVYCDQWKDHTVVVTSKNLRDKAEQLERDHQVRFWIMNDTQELSGMREFSERCVEEGIGGVYFEGGARLLSSLIQLRQLNYLYAYRAPKLLADQSALGPFMGLDPASMDEAIHLKSVRHDNFGDDQLMRGFVVYPDK